MTDLSSLIERIEKSEGADRLLDADIAVAAFGLIRGKEVEGAASFRNPATNRIVNAFYLDKIGPQPSEAGEWPTMRGWTVFELPPFTASIDAAVTLVPDGWYWRAGHGVLWPGWAHLNLKHPDHCDRGDEHTAHAATPALALCAAALKARNPSHEG